MALKLKISKESINPFIAKILGIDENVDSLYLKITNQRGNVASVNLNLSTFINIEEETCACINNSSYSFTPDLEGDNFIRQGYDYLKTLPEFAGCEDC